MHNFPTFLCFSSKSAPQDSFWSKTLDFHDENLRIFWFFRFPATFIAPKIYLYLADWKFFGCFEKLLVWIARISNIKFVGQNYGTPRYPSLEWFSQKLHSRPQWVSIHLTYLSWMNQLTLHVFASWSRRKAEQNRIWFANLLSRKNEFQCANKNISKLNSAFSSHIWALRSFDWKIQALNRKNVLMVPHRTSRDTSHPPPDHSFAGVSWMIRLR